MTENTAPDAQQGEQASRELAVLQKRLRELRGEETLRALAETAHYSATALNRAETKPKRPTWAVVEAYVKGRGGSVEEFRSLWEAAGYTTADDPVAPEEEDPGYDPGLEDVPPSPPTPPDADRRGNPGFWSGWTRGRVTGLVIIAVVAIVVLLLPVISSTWSAPQEACPRPTVTQRTESGATQCVGLVADPSSVAPEFGLNAVLNKINAQNAAIGPGQPAVSLAYVLPLPGAPSSLATELGYELGGVQLAQQRANERSDVGGDLPKVRILVYNTGEDNASRSALLTDIDAPNSDIVGVLGLGQSRPETVLLVDELTKRLIATFPARATADSLTTAPTGLGLFRVPPLNRDLAAAAVAELPARAKVALLQDADADPYKTGLGESFTKAFASSRPGATLIPLPTYDSALNAVGTAFDNQIIPSLCQSDADSVFVAGRGRDIEKFLIALANESQCTNRDEPIIVLTGDDGVDVLNQLRRANKRAAPDPKYVDDALNSELLDAFNSGKFVYRYTALAHPDLWATSEFQGSRQFNDALRPFDPQRFSNDPTLQEGAAMMGYDSTITAVRCVRRAATQRDVVADTSAVTGACYQFSAADPIFGVSGRIYFNSSGVATGKLIPVVEVRSDGSASVVDGTFRASAQL